MKVSCSTLFDKVRGYWPEQVDINRESREIMTNFYWQLDSTIDHEKDHWLNIGCWAYHQALDTYMREQRKAGRVSVKPSEVPMSLFNKQMLFNLQEDSWEKERALYIAE